MDVKSVALQLRKLASDPDNQVYIVNEKGCMKGLMGFLDNGDNEVVCISLQALQFLSAHPLNKEPLSKQDGLLGKLVNFTDSDDENIKKLASSTLDNLQEFINGEDAVKKEAEKKQAPVRFTPSYLYNVPLQIKERVVPLQMNLIERALIAVKGVVSVTISKNEVIVYTRAQDQDIVQLLVAAVKSVGFTAIPGQGQDGHEKKTSPSTAAGPSSAIPVVTKPSNATAVSVAAKENGPQYANKPTYPNAPSYLNANRARTSESKTALTEYTGYGQSSIDARLKKQRSQAEQEQEKKGTVRSLFGAVTGAVTSYFW